ncbi:hypothetical protein [Aquimarina sp. AU474]|uniref:hypothetical protein n=1 Tax=Aquimarina sp. AU474 TaxID=2108529 RepID=UPI000D68C420|nr:hypothetical protein [Aquimarina sp. AU474]
MKDKIVIMEVHSLRKFINKSNMDFRLKLPFLTGRENIFYANKIIRNLGTCGCFEGKIGAMISVITFFVIREVFKANFPFNHIVFNVLLFVFVGAIGGKFIGKMYSKITIRIIVTRLSRKEKLSKASLSHLEDKNFNYE